MKSGLYERLFAKLIIFACALTVILLGIPAAFRYLSPFILAFLIAWMLNPVINFLNKRLRLPRKPVAFVTVSLVLLALIFVTLLISRRLVGEVVQLAANWQSVWRSLEAGIESLFEFVERAMVRLPDGIATQLDVAAQNLLDSLQTLFYTLVTGAAGFVGGFAKSLPSAFITTVIFLTATFLIAADYTELKTRIAARMSASLKRLLVNVRRIVTSALGGYLRSQLILALVVSGISLVGFILMRISYAVLLALFVGLIDFLPYIGSGALLIPWAAVSFLSGDMTTAFGMVFLSALIFVVRRLIEPRVIGGQTGISTLATLVAMYIGFRISSVLGLIFGPIVAMILKNVIDTGIFTDALGDLALAWEQIKKTAVTKDKPIL